VILKQDVAVGPLTVAGNLLEFALRHSDTKVFRVSFALQDSFAIEPVLNGRPVANDAGGVPLAIRNGLLGGGWRIQIIKRAQAEGSVTNRQAFGGGGGACVVINDLKLKPAFAQIGLNQVKYSAVAPPLSF
jgi:hypothetical protein